MDYRITASELGAYYAEDMEAATKLLEFLAEQGCSVVIEHEVPFGGWNEAEQVCEDGFRWEVIMEAHAAGDRDRFTWQGDDLRRKDES